VLQGNLLVVPVGDALLYVEPVYLKASQGGLPSLARIVVSDGKEIAMAKTLDVAIAELQQKTPPMVSPAEQKDCVERSELADRGEILLASLGIFQHCFITRCPVGRTDFIRIGFNVLVGLKNTKRLVDVASNRSLVDRHVHHHPLGVDDEQAAIRLAVFVEDVVSGADLTLEVGDERIVDIADTTLVARGLDPGQVAVLAVDGDSKNFGVLAGEVCDPVAEGRDLRGADEGEVQGVEEQHDVLAPVLGQADFLELLIHHSGGGEIGGHLAHAQATVFGHVRDAVVINRSSTATKP